MCGVPAEGALRHVVVRHDTPWRPHLPDRCLVGQVLLVVEVDVVFASLEVVKVDGVSISG